MNGEAPIIETELPRPTVGMKHVHRSDETAAVETANVSVTAILWKFFEVNVPHGLGHADRFFFLILPVFNGGTGKTLRHQLTKLN